MYTKQQIIASIKNIVNNIKPINDDVFEKNINTPLTGIEIQFSALDMVYLYFELQKEFGIKFEAADLENYGLLSIQKISDKLALKL